jgi:hypothetical protein
MSCVWLEMPGQPWRAVPILATRPLTGEELGVRGVLFCGIGPGGAVLMSRPGVWVRVNGQPVLGGLRVLEHRDEVLLPGACLFFSLESTPTVSPFRVVEGGRAPTCPICRGPIREGMPAVQCPGCGRWFHQLDAKPCWTYAPTCRFCSHPTSFAAEAAWRPDKEELHV